MGEEWSNLSESMTNFVIAPGWQAPPSVDLPQARECAKLSHHAVSLNHRFYATDGESLTEFASGEAEVRSHVFEGLVLRREWLDPMALPDVDACLRTANSKG